MKYKFLSVLFIFSIMSSSIFAQSLGNDDQSDEAADSGVFGDDEAGLTFEVLPHQWVDLTDPTKEAQTLIAEAVTGNSADEAADRINMDMEFKYFGESYRQCIITINGFIALGTQDMKNVVGSNSWSVGAIPSPRAPNNIVAPFWADLSFENSTGFVFYRTFKPEKQDKTADHLIVQWEDAGFFQDPDTRCTFQAVLFNEGGIMFQYKEFEVSQRTKSVIAFYQEIGYYYTNEDGEIVYLDDLTEFEIIQYEFRLAIGFENETGLKGAAWNLPVTGGFTIGNDLVPDWVSGSAGNNFLDFQDGRDRKNNAVTGSSSGGCFISKKDKSLDR